MRRVVSSVSSAFLVMCWMRAGRFRVPWCAFWNRGGQNLGEGFPFLVRVVWVSPSVDRAMVVAGVLLVVMVGLMVFEVMSSVMFACSCVVGVVIVWSVLLVSMMMNASPMTAAAHWVGVAIAMARVVPSWWGLGVFRRVLRVWVMVFWSSWVRFVLGWGCWVAM